MRLPIWMIGCLVLPMMAAQKLSLEGYVFREAGGGPPRRSVTVELLDQGKARYHTETRPDGGFTLGKLREGRYKIRARFADFVMADDTVTVASRGKNFAALMLLKRRAGTQPFGMVSAGRLALESDARLQRTLREGSRLVVRRDFAAAVEVYERALTAGPQPEVEDALGLLYLYMGEFPKAYRVLEKAIHDDPKYLLAYSHLAASYLEQRRYGELAAVSNRALAVDPRWMSGYTFLAEARAGEGDLREAQRAAETASGIARGRAPGPYLVLAKIYWAGRDCGNARRNLERYFALDTSAQAAPELAKWTAQVRACRAGP